MIKDRPFSSGNYCLGRAYF